MQKKSFIDAFKFAFNGLALVFKERNFKRHLVSSALVIMTATYVNVTAMEWCILSLCMGLVLGFETLNTAIEKTVDRIGTEQHELSGQIKDISAAAVLLVSIVSAVVGVLIFWPYFFN